MAQITRIDRTLDYETGEILEIQGQTWVSDYPSEPDFVKLYIKAWCAFKNVKDVNTSFLYALLPYMTYAKNEQLITLSSTIKKRIADELHWSQKHLQQRFNTELEKLIKYGIIKRLGRGTYQVNPELIGKGEWKDIAKLRATFHLSNGKVTHEFEE